MKLIAVIKKMYEHATQIFVGLNEQKKFVNEMCERVLLNTKQYNFIHTPKEATCRHENVLIFQPVLNASFLFRHYIANDMHFPRLQYPR